MMRFFLWLLPFLLVAGLYADDVTFKRAEAYMQSGSQSDIFRAYNDYKNLYLQSMVSGDEKLKIDSLQGIVASGTKLDIDIDKYEKELKTLSSKITLSSYNQPEPKPMKKTKHIEDVQVGVLAKLQGIKWRDNTLVLIFEQPIEAKQINYFTLHDKKKKRYRYVYDIKTSMLTSSHNITKKGISQIKIAQFNPETLRLAIENSVPVELSHVVNKATLEITFGSESSTRKALEVVEKAVPMPKTTRGKKIVVDPGHGGTDPGAIGYNDHREKMIVFNISQELVKILKSRGHAVYMTRDDDTFVKLSKRTEFANDKKADIFVSVHANSVPNGSANDVHGIECYFLSPSRSERAKKAAAQENSADMSDMNMYGKDSYLNLLNHHNIVASNKLAIDLQRGMLSALNPKYKDVRDGGVKEGPFWVLVGAQMPSVLVEVGFLSHPKEAIRLADKEYVKIMARGMAEGIERYFVNNQ
ncbi:MAG: N-acetylmuramoyl-L-alanine amidase [Sulfurimonas sp.]|uniref:N-acetylmuramoyl-L-alanine amidase family protein n=1 Tax=Sulfurimonas sp. TaxID=2022749 RepID=UPI002603419F|nr:N-acetylmuramoyl-L-alanine amidase [Sulfurimonas sp.]MDD2652181.1 N-acetylmuramoyl-L-alanine amidase [Sulfurimonas sp.]MDD3450536.1 N-acetylmuramoyl-L-alanine amidase [Sulfurimonas sp.]